MPKPVSRLRPAAEPAAMLFVDAHAQLHDVVQQVLFELRERQSPLGDELFRAWTLFQVRLAEVASA